MSLLAWLNPIEAITGAIAKAYTAKQNATTDRERIEAEERIKSYEARRDVLISEGTGTRVNAYIRALIAFGPMVYLNKIFLWDKVLKLGATDPLDDNLWAVVTAVIAFYFLYEGVRLFKR